MMGIKNPSGRVIVTISQLFFNRPPIKEHETRDNKSGACVNPHGQRSASARQPLLVEEGEDKKRPVRDGHTKQRRTRSHVSVCTIMLLATLWRPLVPHLVRTHVDTSVSLRSNRSYNTLTPTIELTPGHPIYRTMQGFPLLRVAQARSQNYTPWTRFQAQSSKCP